MREICTSGSVRACWRRLQLATRKRVRNGLANARAKGKILGRKKMRNSVLIRELLKSGLSYRAIATIAKASHGSVHAEKKSMLAEEALLAKQKEQEEIKNQKEKLANDALIANALAKKSSAVIFPEAA